MATAAELRKRNSTATFRWTEFPWLILEYLDGGAGCAHRERTAVEVAAMEAAIAQDDVIWHATALNFLPELLDEQMWSESLGLASVGHQDGTPLPTEKICSRTLMDCFALF